MKELLATIEAKKQALDQLQPLPSELTRNLRDWFRVELTYTSNALEGNTLTRQETALVLERGIAVAGKKMVELLEATNHAAAWDYVETVANQQAPLTEEDVLNIHRRILAGIDDANVGQYRKVPVRIAGSTAIMPNYVKVPELMMELAQWLAVSHKEHSVKVAAEAHYKLVSIHPFIDGNGRTARLIMNLLLLRQGYPPAIIFPQERGQYIESLERGQTGGSTQDYYEIICKAVIRSLDIYLDIPASQTTEESSSAKVLSRIGQLAEATGEAVSTLRYWTKSGLLVVRSTSKGGYSLYDSKMISRVKEIRRLQSKERLTLEEIRQRLVIS